MTDRHRLNRWILGIVLLLVLFLSGCSDQQEEADKLSNETRGEAWVAGYGEATIVPADLANGTYYMGGYNIGQVVTEILDPPKVKALWLDDQSGRGGVLLAVVDCIGLAGPDIQRIKADLAPLIAQAGARAVHIISTHTHAGIDTLGLWGPLGSSGRSPAYVQSIVEQTLLAAQLAYEDRNTGKLWYGSADTGDLQRDSRPPHVYDAQVYSIRFAAEDGGAGIRIVNYGAHPEALRSDNRKLSADFPAYLSERIAEISGERTLFLPGALGGLIMTERLRDEQGMEYPLEQNVRMTGQRLADTVLSIDEERELQPDLQMAREPMNLPLENLLFAGAAAADIIAHRAVKGEGKLELALPTQLGYVGLDDLSLLLVPGEIFPELVMGGYAEADLAAAPELDNPPPLRELAGERELLIVGLADDMIGYIVPPNDFFVHPSNPYFERGTDASGRRHYEETNSLGPDTAWKIAQTAQRMFKRIDEAAGK